MASASQNSIGNLETSHNVRYADFYKHNIITLASAYIQKVNLLPF